MPKGTFFATVIGIKSFIHLLIFCFVVSSAKATIDVTLQMQLGNPSGAIVDTNNHNHYLVQRTVEALDYSDNLGEPVWVSWDLTTSDVGPATRSTSYYTDTNLPSNFYRVTDNNYNGVGNIDFNRGHMCDSEDRTDTTADNKLVFFMSNIIPQSGPQNQGVWGNLEGDCRTFATNGNELLITCGPSGFGTNTIPSGVAYIASNCWKIVVLVPLGSGTALSRLTTSNRVICVSIPNVTNGLVSTWQTYLTNVAQIEHDTGFTFFSAVPSNIATIYRYKIDGAPAPGITNVSPASGSVGSSVVIQGTNFSTAAVVWFNGTNASFVTNSANQLTAIVPANATSGQISVVAAGGLAVSAGTFTIMSSSPPNITNFSPSSGIAGSSVTIQGTNFSGATAVKFNGSNTSFVINSSNQITAAVPTNASTGPISVTTANGTGTSVANFTVLPFAPGITNFSPTSGVIGSSVTMQGTNFTGATAVAFNGATASFVINSSNQITAAVPTSATTGPLSVTTAGGTGTSLASFTVLPFAPGITNFSPASGLANSSVTIQGTNFSGATAVKFNGTNASFVINSSNQITATVPTNATTGLISVTTPGGVGYSSGNFTVTLPSPPVIQFIHLIGGNVTLGITGTLGTTYTIQSKTNFASTNWTTLLTTNPASLPFIFTDTNQYPQCFYRVKNP